MHLFSAGYGYITPQTSSGQILCIFISLIGIPITLLALKSVGELITEWINGTVKKFEKKILKRPEPKHVHTKSAVVLFSFMIIIIIVSAMSFSLPEWNFVEGVYFWFITFSTIGFGDYVPTKRFIIQELSLNSSENYENKYESIDMKKTATVLFMETLLALYYILGLCGVSGVVNSIMAAMEEHKCRPRCPGCTCIRPRTTHGHSDNEENNTPEPNQRDTEMKYLEMESMTLVSVTKVTGMFCH